MTFVRWSVDCLAFLSLISLFHLRFHRSFLPFLHKDQKHSLYWLWCSLSKERFELVCPGRKFSLNYLLVGVWFINNGKVFLVVYCRCGSFLKLV